MNGTATAKAPGVGWQLVNSVAVAVARNLVYTDPSQLAGVRVLGVEEHVWKHTPPAWGPILDSHRCWCI